MNHFAQNLTSVRYYYQFSLFWKLWFYHALKDLTDSSNTRLFKKIEQISRLKRFEKYEPPKTRVYCVHYMLFDFSLLLAFFWFENSDTALCLLFSQRCSIVQVCYVRLHTVNIIRILPFFYSVFLLINIVTKLHIHNEV